MSSVTTTPLPGTTGTAAAAPVLDPAVLQTIAGRLTTAASAAVTANADTVSANAEVAKANADQANAATESQTAHAALVGVAADLDAYITTGVPPADPNDAAAAGGATTGTAATGTATS